MQPENLADLQREFWSLISRPAEPGREPAERAAAPLAVWIEAESEQRARDRVAIYSGMYFNRLLEILIADFPKTHELVGTDSFTEVARAYLAAHPSVHPSVRHAGDGLAEFVRDHALSRTFPYLADLAALERARVDVFDRENVAPRAVLKRLRTASADQWPGLRFDATPALRIVRMGFPADEMWNAIDEDAPLPAMEPAPSVALVWRKEFTVFHRSSDPVEAAALGKLIDGEPFGVVCQVYADGVPARAETTIVSTSGQGVAAPCVTNRGTRVDERTSQGRASPRADGRRGAASPGLEAATRQAAAALVDWIEEELIVRVRIPRR